MVPSITLFGTIGSGHRRVPLEPWHRFDRNDLGVMVGIVCKHGLVRYVKLIMMQAYMTLGTPRSWA